MPKLMEVLEFFDDKGDTMVIRIPSDGQAEIKWGAQLTVRESQWKGDAGKKVINS